MGMDGCLWKFIWVKGVFGDLWESMDKYEYVGVHGYLRDSMSVYGSLCMMIEIYGCLWESMDKYEYVRDYGSFCVSMGVYGGLWV